MRAFVFLIFTIFALGRAQIREISKKLCIELVTKVKDPLPAGQTITEYLTKVRFKFLTKNIF